MQEIQSPIILVKVCCEECLDRFETANNAYCLAYLVEEIEELKWTDLKLGDSIKCGPNVAMVTRIDDVAEDTYHIFAGDWIDDSELRRWVKVK